MAEPNREFAFNRLKVGTEALKPDATPCQSRVHDGAIPVEDRDATPDHRRDPIPATSPEKGRIPPPKPDLKGPERGFDEDPVTPTVVANPPATAPRIDDLPPALPTASYYILARPHLNAVSNEPHSQVDRHASQ